MASVTFEELLQHKMSRQDELYFSIVLRRECCASRESLSTSFSTNTAKTKKEKHKIMCLGTSKIKELTWALNIQNVTTNDTVL